MWLRPSFAAPRSAKAALLRADDRLEQLAQRGRQSEEIHGQRAVNAVRMTDHGRGKRATATLLAYTLVDADEVLLDRQRCLVDRRRQPADDVRNRLVDAVDAAQDRVTARENA